MSETALYNAFILAATKLGGRLFRNNCGLAIYPDGSKVKYGVCNPGGSDLIGWTSVIVTPEMVGNRVAIFTAVEGKVKKLKASDHQQAFINAVLAAGGRAGVAHNEREAGEIISGIQEPE